MTAVTTDLNTPRREGNTRNYPVGATATILAGTLLCWDTANDDIVNGADAAARSFAGVASEAVDNSAGASGALAVEVFDRGEFLFAHGEALTVADIGKEVYLADNATVDFMENITNPIFVGVITGIGEQSANDCWVEIQPDAPTPARARGDRLYLVEVAGVNATAFDLAAAAAEYGGSDFTVTTVLSVQSFVTSGGASDGLKFVTSDWTLASGAISAVGDETANTWVIHFLGRLQG